MITSLPSKLILVLSSASPLIKSRAIEPTLVISLSWKFTAVESIVTCVEGEGLEPTPNLIEPESLTELRHKS